MKSEKVRIGPLPLPNFEHVLRFRMGERLRVVGLRVRQDSSIQPTNKTVVFSETDLPVINVKY